MKTALKILSLASVAMLFSSCSQEPIYYDASGNSVNEGNSLSSKGKYAAAPAPQKKRWCSPDKEKKQKVVRKKCAKPYTGSSKGTGCLSIYYPNTGKCDVVGDKVLTRATMQGGTGEPHLGLIPTMKTLAP